MKGYIAQGGNVTFLTFDGVDHTGAARKFFHIEAARDWLFDQVQARSGEGRDRAVGRESGRTAPAG